MNNEEKILAILEAVQADISDLKAGQAKLEAGQAEIKQTLNAVFEHTAKLTESQAITDKTIGDLTAMIKESAFDILRLKAVR